MSTRRFGVQKPAVLPELARPTDHYKKIALFVDGANFYVACKVLQFDVDWKKFLAYYREQGDLIRVFYYTGILPLAEGEHDRMRPTLDWMDYNGFSMRTKMAKRFIGPDGQTHVKGNMDIELCLDMIDIAPYVTDMYLFSGDGDFLPLVKRIQLLGVRVHVVSTIAGNKGEKMCADEIRRQADFYIDLVQIAKNFKRGPEE